MHRSPEPVIRRYMGVFLVICGAWVTLKAKSMNDIRSTAALLAGDHVDLELYVDDCLRNCRVNALWTIGATLLQTVTFTP